MNEGRNKGTRIPDHICISKRELQTGKLIGGGRSEFRQTRQKAAAVQQTVDDDGLGPTWDSDAD